MKAHELARQLLEMPDMEVSASCDIETGVYNEGAGIIEEVLCVYEDCGHEFESDESFYDKDGEEVE